MKRNINQNVFLGLFIGLFSGTAAFANPNGADVINGQVQFNHPDINTLEITNSNGAIINWQQFSIQQNEITRFIQDSANSAVLNRVTGGDPSSILGQLLSNGRIFLINPNGIVFGPDAIIDTAGLIASTLDITDEDFINQNLKFQGTNAADISNQGYIKAGANGDIFLIAPNIENSGIIETDGGQLVLAAGESITIASLDSDHIVFDVQAPENEVLNLGEIITNGGAAKMFAGTIKHSGSINANSISVDENGKVQLFAKADIEIATDAIITANGSTGGEIKIENDEGTVWNSGTIEATGEKGKGGHVEILGERVALMDNASIDVSGESGGGEVYIGGDYKGENPDIKNAKQTYVSEDASIKADAIINGDGGKVIVWADETTRTYGDISVAGGSKSGDGGFVETSGKQYLDVTKAPDITAANGESGTWLLDPEDITISTAADSNITGASPFSPAAAGSSNLDRATLLAALAGGGTIIVDTSGGGAGTGDITISNLIQKTTGITAATLELRAHNDINIFQDLTSTSGILNLVLNANQDNTGGGVINMGATNQDINTNGGTLDTSGDTVNLVGELTLTDTNWTNTGTVNWTTATGSLSFNQTITNPGNFNINTSGAANDFVGGGTFINQGTLTKLAASTGVTEFRASTVFNSLTGSTIDVQVGSGRLELGAGGTHTGALTFSNQGPTFVNSTHTFNGVTISGNGFSVAVQGTASEPTFNGTGLTTLAGVTVNLADLTLDTNWINQGTIDFIGGLLTEDFTINGGSTFTNQGGFNINTTAVNADILGAGTFNNAGSVIKLSSSTVDTTISTVFDSTAAGSTSIQSSAGNLSLNNGGTHTGDFSVASGTVLQFTNGTHTINGGTTSGAGDIAFTGGTTTYNAGSTYTISGDTGISGGASPGVVFNIDAVTNTFTHDGGNYGGGSTGSLTTTGWTPTVSATLNDLTLKLAANANISLNLGGPIQLFGTASIENGGTLSLANGNFIVGGSGTFINNGSLTLNSYNFNTLPFTNQGSLFVTGASGSSFSGAFTQVSGVTLVDNSSTLTAANLNLNGGVLHGDGTIAGNVNNNGGIVTAGNTLGMLNITGSYVQGAGGTLQADLGGATSAGVDYDLLNVTGSVSLAGTLDIQLTNGFTGNIGEKFDIIDAASITGDFTTINTPSTHSFTNSVDTPLTGDYQIEITSVNQSTIDATNNILVLNDFEDELFGNTFTFGDDESASGNGEDDEKKLLACQ